MKERLHLAHVVALIHEEEGSYGISFPDFPGCVSGGDTLDEAIERGASALAFHVDGMVQDSDPLPAIRSLTALRRDDIFNEDATDAIVAAVPLELPGKPVSVNIVLDVQLLEAIDRAAEADGRTRSGFIADAAKSRLRGAA